MICVSTRGTNLAFHPVVAWACHAAHPSNRGSPYRHGSVARIRDTVCKLLDFDRLVFPERVGIRHTTGPETVLALRTLTTNSKVVPEII